MSALYQMRYQGVAGNGHGAMYIGKGVVVGIDISGARFNGTYTLSGTTIDGTATLTSAGGALVTGQDVPCRRNGPHHLQPAGRFRRRPVSPGGAAGRRVGVAFNKIGDVP